MANAETSFEQYPTIKTKLEAGILLATLNRPDRLNAFNVQMMEDMLALYEAADADDDVRVVIVTGEGRGFCAGADLSGGGDTFDDGSEPRVRDKKREGAAAAPQDGGGLVSIHRANI